MCLRAIEVLASSNTRGIQRTTRKHGGSGQVVACMAKKLKHVDHGGSDKFCLQVVAITDSEPESDNVEEAAHISLSGLSSLESP